jgi:hypothetical protein
MRDDHFQKFAKVRVALLAAEDAHPGSNALKALHARASEALDSHWHLFTDEQYVALGGGVPKEPV